jgi:hypothetical protein
MMWRSAFTATVRPLLPVLAVALWAPAARPWAQESLETDVKAAYLYKFAPFVDWPPRSFQGGQDPLVICVVGKDSFGTVLDRVVAGQRVDGHPIIVRRLASADRNLPCHIAYLGGSRAQPVGEALRLLRGSPVLTVTDGASAPGILDFTLDQGRVRFRVDDQAAADGGLVISSKLLNLALSVRPRAGAR